MKINTRDKKFEEFKHDFIQKVIQRKKDHENSRYGKLIVQSNELQFFLTVLIRIKTKYSDKTFVEWLETATLGNVINSFVVCADSEDMASLIPSLREYNSSRNALAHKMYSKKRLTLKECEISIELGDIILKLVKELLPQTFRKVVI